MTTTLSSKGQVVLPRRLRTKLGLLPGTKFDVHTDKGGEVVSFSYGLIGADKPFHDTGKGSLNQVALTKEWKQYTIDLKGQDLSRIVTGFAYSLAASGQPVALIAGVALAFWVSPVVTRWAARMATTYAAGSQAPSAPVTHDLGTVLSFALLPIALTITVLRTLRFTSPSRNRARPN